VLPGTKLGLDLAKKTRDEPASDEAIDEAAPQLERDEAAHDRSEASVQAFRDALERSITISRDRLQEVVDDAVRRGRMTRGDAEDLVGRLISRGREQAEDIISELEQMVSALREDVPAAVTNPRRTAGRAADRARRELEDAAGRARREVGGRVERGRRRTVAAVDQPLASADRVRRRTGVGFPISAYDQLTTRQIDRRLTELTQGQLRKVRDYEKGNKARKGVLRSIDRKLG
jgi:polyhydroxyalkanoate synthesis regulator phasin